MKKVGGLLVILALATTNANAQNPGDVFELKEHKVQFDSISNNRACYTVLLSEATPTTVGNKYCRKLSDFLRDYKLVVVQDTVVNPPPPTDTIKPPPTDTIKPPPPIDSTAIIYAQHNFEDGTLGPFRNVATAPNTLCNFEGEVGKCSAYQWIRNGKLEIWYERHSSLQTIDSNKQIEWAGTNIGWGQTLYIAGTWRFPRITPEIRQWIDSVAAKAGIASITDDQYLRALMKINYIDRGQTDHAVVHIHDKILRFTPAVKFDKVLGQCVATGAQVFLLYQFLGEDLLDRDYRIEILYKRSSGPMVGDGELTVWIDYQQVAHVTNICTNRTTDIHWKNSFGQQFQFNGAYYQFRVLDDLLVANKRPF